MRYSGGWSANNCGTYSYHYESDNKKELAKFVRDICRGNVFAGNTGHWYVRENTEEAKQSDNNIYSGTVRN